MPDSAPEAATSRRLEPASEVKPQAAQRTPVAAAVFLLAALIGFGFDVQHDPERLAAASMVFAMHLAVCGLAILGSAIAARWTRVVLSLTAPMLPLSIGIYGALVGATLDSCTISLCLCVGAAVLLLAGPIVQLTIVVGAAAGYASVLTATSPANDTNTVATAAMIGVSGLSVIVAFWQQRRHAGALSPQVVVAGMQTEHAHATALLSASTALAATVRDFDALARVAADQVCALVDADWSAVWYRNGESAFRAVAVSGLPTAIVAAVKAYDLVPEKIAALYERAQRESALALSQRDAQRMLPIDAVAPILKQALVAAVHPQHGIDALLFAGFATRNRRLPAGADTLLAGFAAQVGSAITTAHLVEDAHSANRAKSEFIATMSHELRTPINVVMGYADLLIEGAFGNTTPDQLDVINRVRHQAAQLLDLVQPMLDLTRLEARQTTVVREPLRLHELIERLQLTVPPSWCKPGVVLSWCAPIGPDVVMQTDRSKVEMIVRNLIHNALKYTDQGEVTVDIDSTTPGYVHIIVRDTGTGIATHDMPVLFEMFGQSTSELPRDGGVGLGLYIVKRLTDVLGGRVTVESTRGAGSTFTVTLPLEASAAPA